MLVSTEEMLAKAQASGYAVGHFNTSDLEMTQAIIEAATELKAPVIIATSVKAMEFAHVEHLAPIVRQLAAAASVPVALHLDHGPSLKWVALCIQNGYTSIMLDVSSKPYEENVALVKGAVELCEPHNIPVEAELGVLKGVEDDVSAAEHIYTDPAVAAQFVADTGCKSLAVAIGTSHGAYKFHGSAHIDLARLEAIRKEVTVPLVLHGASGVPEHLLAQANQFGGRISDAQGVPDETIREAIKRGICKVNTDTDLRLAFTAAGRKFYAEHPEDFDPRAFLAVTREAVKDIVKDRIRLFGSDGKA
jgi:fructose-bisphosphate aldolase class II